MYNVNKRNLKIGIIGAGIQGVCNALFLQKKGFKVTVENCEKRIFKTSEYQLKGCTIVKKGSWVSADEDTIIIGLKEINPDLELSHIHIMFAHIFKKQADSVKILNNPLVKEEKLFLEI